MSVNRLSLSVLLLLYGPCVDPECRVGLPSELVDRDFVSCTVETLPETSHTLQVSRDTCQPRVHSRDKREERRTILLLMLQTIGQQPRRGLGLLRANLVRALFSFRIWRVGGTLLRQTRSYSLQPKLRHDGRPGPR